MRKIYNLLIKGKFSISTSYIMKVRNKNEKGFSSTAFLNKFLVKEKAA